MAVRMTPTDPPDDDLIDPAAPLAEVAARPNYARSRDPVEMHVRVRGDGMRIDQYLHLYFSDFSRSELQRAIGGGHVLVNGRPTKASYKVRNDDKLRVALPEPVHDVIVPEAIPLEVLYRRRLRGRHQ